MPTLADIAGRINAPLPAGARPDLTIRGINGLADAGPDEVSFLAAEPHAKRLADTRAAAVLVSRRIKLGGRTVPPGTLAWPVDDADLAAAAVLALFAPPVPRPPVGVDPGARVAASAVLGADCRVGFGAFVGDRAVLGARCVLHPGAHVGADSALGDDCELYPHVVVRERVTLGHRVVVHANSVLGTDGFGYRWDGSRHAKVPQIGTVVVEDDVEIGSCSCVDRAKFAETRIGRGTKIDNLVQVGHNVRLGPHCMLVGQSGVAGSATLGAGVVLGGQSAVRDQVTMGDGAMLAACSGAMDDVPAKQVVSGLPAVPHRQAMREHAAVRELPDLRVQVRRLQEQVDRLTALLGTRAGADGVPPE